jgi:hypothetical protein
MGPEDSANYSALLANAVITGSFITPGYIRYTLFWSITAAFVILLIVFMMQPAALLIFGLGLTVLASSAFGCVFVFYSYWIDPLIVFASSLSGVLLLFSCKTGIINRRKRHYNKVYGTAVSKNHLKELIRLGRPRITNAVVTQAAVIAIRDPNILNREDHEKPQDAGKIRKMFLSAVKNIVFEAGGIIAGFEGDTVIACFGSPLDKSGDPVEKAMNFISGLLKDEKLPLRFGIDAGECNFSWSPESGFSVNGRPAVRARVLASKTVRLKARALITDYVREKINIEAKKIGSLFDGSEPVFEFRNFKL